MSSKLKRDRVEEEDDDDDDSDDSSVLDSEDEGIKLNGNADGDSDLDADDAIYVDFTFCDPQPSHYHSIKRMMSDFVPKKDGVYFDASGMADLITSQVSVGTIIQAQDETDAYGFITAINLHQHQVINPFT
jgi:hypothetical protein